MMLEQLNYPHISKNEKNFGLPLNNINNSKWIINKNKVEAIKLLEENRGEIFVHLD